MHGYGNQRLIKKLKKIIQFQIITEAHYLLAWGCPHSPLLVQCICPGGLVVKNPPVNAGDARDSVTTSGSGRSIGGRNGNPLQYFYLGNPMHRAAQQATVHGVATELYMKEHTYTQVYPTLQDKVIRSLQIWTFDFVNLQR